MILPSQLRKPRVLFCLGLVLLIAALWLLGPRLGMPGVELRLVAILLLVTLVLAFFHLKALVAARPAERQAPDGPARPEPSPELTFIREQVNRVVKTLKVSQLGRTKGRAALYELPWILVAGHASSGKTQAILRSGLTFPLSRKDAPGLDDPRYCRWDFSTEGVLVDAPGWYFTGPQDQAEWKEYLRLFKSHRPGGPLEGILLAVELPDLLHADAATLSSKARQIRQRLGEAEQALGLKLPVYLLFTKMDLLPGFASFFEELPEEERGKVWGATFPHDQTAFDPLAALDQEFALLHQGLVNLGYTGFPRHRALADRPALATFPAEFRRLAKPLHAFTQELVGDDPYHARPFLRGFYFTSAQQAPEKALADPLPADFGLAPGGARAALAESRPYFLEGVFRQVLFPDRHLAGRLSMSARRRTRLGWLGAGILLAALVSGAWAWSFNGNRKLVAEAREELAQAEALLADPRLEHRMKGLMVLQFRLEQFCRYRQEGRPRALGWGLYQGRGLERKLRARYFQGVSQLMLAPVKESLEAALTQTAAPQNPVRAPKPRPRPTQRPRRPLARPTILRVAQRFQPVRPRPARPAPNRDAEQLYVALKTYLMLNDRRLMDATHLTDQLPRHWRPFLEAAGAKRAEILPMAKRTVAFYVSQIQEPDLPLIQNRADLVAEARRQLKSSARLRSPLEQVYDALKAKANTEFDPLTLARILQDRDLDLLAADRAVPGAFTREACDGCILAALREAGENHQAGDWVLAQTLDLAQAGPREGVAAALEALYKADFEREWDAFLRGLRIHGFATPSGAAAALGRLGDPQTSPLKVVLGRAAYETAWDNPSQLHKAAGKLKGRILSRTEHLLGQQAPPEPAKGFGPLGSRFSALAFLATPGEGGAMPLDGYLQLLQKTRARLGGIALSGDPCAGSREYLQSTLQGAGSELAEARQYFETVLLARVDAHGREQVGPLLMSPLVLAFAALVPAAEEDLNRAWAQHVWGPWRPLAAKYPFADSGNEAPMAEIHRFLKPGEGTLHRFVDKYLGPLVAVQGDRLVPRNWEGRGLAFREDFLSGVSRLCRASTALEEPAVSRFELQPVPTPGMREILLEIDGQRLLYRNGPQFWTAFTWPGQSSTQGARLQVVAVDGAAAQLQIAPGRLGLLRILDQARQDEPQGGTHTLEWPIRTARAEVSPGRDTVRFNYRMVSGPDPLRLSVLRNHALPPRATH